MSPVPQRFRDRLLSPFLNASFRFLFVGGTTAGLYFIGLFSLLVLNVTSWLAALLAYSVSFVVGYVAHKFFTFQSKSSHAVSLPRYALLQTFCATVAACSALGAETQFPTRPLFIALITTGFLGVATYLISSKWVFSK
jgi:putative flippase GtrA